MRIERSASFGLCCLLYETRSQCRNHYSGLMKVLHEPMMIAPEGLKAVDEGHGGHNEKHLPADVDEGHEADLIAPVTDSAQGKMAPVTDSAQGKMAGHEQMMIAREGLKAVDEGHGGHNEKHLPADVDEGHEADLIAPVTDSAQGKMAPVTDGAQGKMAPVTDVAQGKMAPVTDGAQGKMATVTDGAQGKMAPVTDRAQGKMAPVTDGAQGKMAPVTDGAQGKMAPVTEDSKVTNKRRLKRPTLIPQVPTTTPKEVVPSPTIRARKRSWNQG